MFFVNSKFLFLLVFIILNAELCYSKEHVPVFMWGTKSTFHQSPALHRINEESFRNILTEKMKSNPLIVVFAEHTLSPEDFAHHDANGITPFENLHDYLETSSVDYMPYVQNPIGAIKELGKGVNEVSLKSLLHHFEVPKGDIVIVDLNDAENDEQRIQMLRRHDSAIAKIFGELLKNNDNIIAIYTSHHTSWLAPEVVKHRNVRSLLQDKNETAETPSKPEAVPIEMKDASIAGLIGDQKNLLLYVSSSPLMTTDGKNYKSVDLKVTKCELNKAEVSFQLTGEDVHFDFKISLGIDGYWNISEVSSDSKKFSFPSITVPIGFSYHCFNVSFQSGKEILILPGFQIEPFFKVDDKLKLPHDFDDAYDCIGFTSIPIWSGLFVTLILLLILTFGITFMMDIKTMDKFDDAKGKTITINAAE